MVASLSAGSVALGVGALGANYGAASTGTRSYDATETWNFTLANSRNLSLGLLGLGNYGGGFKTLSFSVKSGSTSLVNDTFTSLSAAQTFFNDHALNLGTFAAGATSLVVDFDLTAVSVRGAEVDYLLSSLAPSGGSGTTAIPATPRSTAIAPTSARRGFGSTLLAGLHPGMAGSTLVAGRSMTANRGAAAAPGDHVATGTAAAEARARR